MFDVQTLARTALADVPMSRGRRETKTDNLAAVLEAAVVEARLYEVPEEEIVAQIRITAYNHARCLALAYAPAEG